ncbi:DUF2249 domain-containing protein [Kineosporia sp. R_H_3]|nr:DUF2249 domain-containing protein [Kineosporia sp. R_H_3]
MSDATPIPLSESRGCGCSTPATGVPELDARLLPRAVRHAAVLGAFDAVPAGGALDLVTPHRPTPLLRQIAAKLDGQVSVVELEHGADEWRGRITREAVAG